MTKTKIIGPFTQILTMDGLPLKGPISDGKLRIIKNGGILINDHTIAEVGDFNDLYKRNKTAQLLEAEKDTVALPGFVDPHTHICFAGSRANDYAMRIAGKTYLEIAQEGGGIWQTVQKTRDASIEELVAGLEARSNQLLRSGITTAEVKSGYGLSLESELKMLSAIKTVNEKSRLDLVSTCLAAHLVPKDFSGSSSEYLNYIAKELLPIVRKDRLSSRVDIFIEDGAFNAQEATAYLRRAKAIGFDLTVHGDQFTTSGSSVAIGVGAISVDHLEASSNKEINALSKSEVIATALPGASLGLGMQFAPSRKLLDAGCTLAIGSDWNPGSAPMGDVVAQSAMLSAAEKLSNAETFAGITVRSAKALSLDDRGVIAKGKIADLVGFPCQDYREILYHQGQLRPNLVYKKGFKIL